MANLSHWDFSESFTGGEAAALILGLQPSSLDETVSITRPLYERMQSDYVVTWSHYLSTMRNTEILGAQNDLPGTALVCDAIKFYLFEIERGNWPAGEVKATFLLWLGNVREMSDFHMQKFSRTELSRWLIAIGMESVYLFGRNQTANARTQSGHWPWGGHHTELLGHLEAAARKFWVNYDPADATTAPVNRDVSEWLVNDRRVSQKMAESIASMLRPDGLPTGPRK